MGAQRFEASLGNTVRPMSQEKKRKCQQESWWVKVLAAWHGDPSSIPGTTWWEERTDLCKLFTDCHMCTAHM